MLHRCVVQPGTAHGRRVPMVGVGMVQGIKALREAEENLRQGRLHNQVIGLPHRAGGVGRTLNGRSGRPWQRKKPRRRLPAGLRKDLVALQGFEPRTCGL